MTTQNRIKLENILKDRFKNDKHTTISSLPQPDSFKDMNKATKRVIEAINKDETITIVGDYDVDGVVSTTIMVEFFNKIGKRVKWIVPNRFKHGYGLSQKIAQKIDDGLVITVDNGITAYETALILKKKNIDLIITDHHTVPKNIPQSFAIINPKQPDCNFAYKNICGAFVAWYFCANINKSLDTNIDMSNFLDLVAVATVADVMPMKDINQTIVRYGLKKLKNTQRVSMQLFKKHINKDILDEVDIGFAIAPILNSAGRLKDASKSVEFLLSNDIQKSQEMFDDLVQLNNLRKTIQQDTFKNTINDISKDDDVIVVANKSYHEGVIGIVASKLSETFKKPAFVFSIKDDIAKGSARTSGDIDLYSLIDQVKSSTKGFGGHKGAAGVVVKLNQLDEFKQKINKAMTNQRYDTKKTKRKYLMKLTIDDIDKELFDIVQKFSPYGYENELPSFLFEDETIQKHIYMGKEKTHQKFLFDLDVELLCFFNHQKIDQNKKISFVANIGKNIFRGNTTYNLILKEFL